MAEALLQPTRIYVKPLLQALRTQPINALAHITGGGVLENIPRVLPERTKAVIYADRWRLPPVFAWLQEAGNVAAREMYRTFNCGIGMVVCVPATAAEAVRRELTALGETVFELGHIDPTDAAEPFVEVR